MPEEGFSRLASQRLQESYLEGKHTHVVGLTISPEMLSSLSQVFPTVGDCPGVPELPPLLTPQHKTSTHQSVCGVKGGKGKV